MNICKPYLLRNKKNKLHILKMIKNPELKIKKIRELKNLTQEYMANQLDISLRAYSKIESGETQLTIKRVNQISRILDISGIDLLNFSEEKVFHPNNIMLHNKQERSENILEQLSETIVLLKQQNQTLIHFFEKNQRQVF